MVSLQEGEWQSTVDMCSMKTGPNPQDLLMVRAVAPNHKDLATIQMFKLWTNAAKKQAFSNTTRQFTDAE
eukprot:5268462-Karenia_brevis.AAC.1